MKNSMQIKLTKIIMISALMFALFMTAMGASALCNAAVGTLSASPSSCSVGDTITLTTQGGVQGSVYRYSYKIDNGTSVYLTTGYISDSSYEFIPTESGTYIFTVNVGGVDYWQASSDEVVVFSESSDESSDEISDESSDESSFTPMSWLPGWNGQQYVQPSYDSTPELSIGDTSFLTAEHIDSNFISIITSAFGAFPPALIAVLPAVILSLFLGWWLHK